MYDNLLKYLKNLFWQSVYFYEYCILFNVYNLIGYVCFYSMSKIQVGLKLYSIIILTYMLLLL